MLKVKIILNKCFGRATRTLDYEDLKKVTPSAKTAKTGFVVVDAVGVTKSKKTTSRQLERKPEVNLKQLLTGIILGERDEDVLVSVANRFIKLDKIIDEKEKEKIEQINNGVRLIKIAENILNAYDEDILNEFGQNENEKDAIKKELIEKAIEPILNPEFRNYIVNIKNKHEQVVDNVNIDKIIYAGWSSNKNEDARKIINNFSKFIKENKDRIEALEIIYTQNYKNRKLTFKSVDEMYEELKSNPYLLTIKKIWEAYSILYPDKVSKRIENKLSDIISLVKFELKQSQTLDLFSNEVDKKFEDWIFKKKIENEQFSEEQIEWLNMMKNHIAISMQITEEDFEYTPFNNKGGLGKFYQLFGNNYKKIIEEVNKALL